MEQVSVVQLRRFVVAHQRFTTRYRVARPVDVEAAVRHLGAVQLDSITTVDRSHRLTLTSRIGNYPRGRTIAKLLRAGRIFEYWSHEACLVPIEDYPLYTFRMNYWRDEHPWFGRVKDRHPDVVAQVLAEITARGPLASRDFEGEKKGKGMWNWKPAKEVLEALFAAGELAAASRESGFQRLYDLPERVIPGKYLGLPVPSEAEWRRAYALRAVKARGALTEKGIAEHCRFRGGIRLVRPHVEALVADGRLRRVAVEDGGPDVFVEPDAVVDGAPLSGGVFLSPFENLMWDRPFVERVFGFNHTIEVYKREHERIYGYYVLPFLYRDSLVARADLKSDRATGALIVRAFHVEPGVRKTKALDDAVDKALDRLARCAGLERVQR
jgi:uncharacterized protein YcaQ